MPWRALGCNLVAGARLALFLPVRALDFRISPGQCAALVLAWLALWIALGVLRQGLPGHVDFGVLTAALAAIPVLLGACLLAAALLGEARLATALAVALLASVPTLLVAEYAVELASDLAASYPPALDWIFLGWAYAVVVRAQHVLSGWRGRRSALALLLFAVLLTALLEISPGAELWVASGEEEPVAEQSLTQEEVFHRQGRLLDERLAALAPERHGVVDLYFVGVAADSGQDTFAAEVASIKELLDARFDTAGRSIALINNPETLMEQPIATISSLRATLARLGNLINAEEDVVLLHLASHGGSDFRLLFDMPPLDLAQLTPSALARMLADSGIKWKIIVISACYAGGYLEPLRGENTLIITAADASHESFGCNYDSDYTWFSEALYEEALRETFSFADAFAEAKKTLAVRERAEGYPASNPQIAMGSAMREKLAALERRLSGGYAPDPQKARAIRVRTSDNSTVVVNGR